jgi:hypothetical protein
MDELLAAADPRRWGFNLGWRPRRTRKGQDNSLLLQQVQDVLEEYRDFLPLTVRQIYYRLIGNYGYEKSKDQQTRLYDLVVAARRAQVIPFEHIRDDRFVREEPFFYGSVDDFRDTTRSMAESYRRDRQEGQRQYLELYCEAAGVVPQLVRVTEPYSVPIYSGGGYDSVTAKYDVAQRIGLLRRVDDGIYRAQLTREEEEREELIRELGDKS